MSHSFKLKRDFRLYLSIIYVAIPFLAFFYKYLIGNKITEYVVFSFFLFIYFYLLIFLKPKANKNIYCFVFLFFFTFVSIIKFFLFESDGDYSLSAGLMELKLIAFSFIIFGYSANSLKINFRKLTYYYSFYIVISFLLLDLKSFGRVSVLSEANYDALVVMLLFLPLLFGKEARLTKLDLLIVSVALLLTFSRTGLFLFSSLLFISPKISKKLKSFLLIVSPIGLYLLFESRGSFGSLDAINSIDRIVFWKEFFNIVGNVDLLKLLFGHNVFYSLTYTTSELGWYLENYSMRHGSDSLFPFIFHAFHARVILSYGVLFWVAFFVLFWFSISRPYRLPLFYIAFVSSFTMSFFYITIIIPILLVYTRFDNVKNK